MDPFVFSSLRFVIAATMFSPFFRVALRDERIIKAGMEIGAWAAGGEGGPRGCWGEITGTGPAAVGRGAGGWAALLACWPVGRCCLMQRMLRLCKQFGLPSQIQRSHAPALHPQAT